MLLSVSSSVPAVDNSGYCKEVVNIIINSNGFSESEKHLLLKLIRVDKKIYKVFERELSVAKVDPASSADTDLSIHLGTFINNYPKMLLGNDLKAYSKEKVPDNTDASIVFDELRSEKTPSVFKHMSEKARSNPHLIEKVLAKDANLKKYVRDNSS